MIDYRELFYITTHEWINHDMTTSSCLIIALPDDIVARSKLEAFEISLAKWFVLSKQNKLVLDGSTNTCGLCQLYEKSNCNDCPIYKDTRRRNCMGNVHYMQYSLISDHERFLPSVMAGIDFGSKQVEYLKRIAMQEYSYLLSLARKIHPNYSWVDWRIHEQN